jgi:uncharacterized RDD family membrane protein YckC
MGHLVADCEAPLTDQTEISGSPCNLIRRLLIIFYDGAIVVAILILATMLAMLLGLGDRTALKDPFFTAYLLFVWYFYLALCWKMGGMTVGMKVWRVRIEDTQGHRPGWGKSALRFVLSFVSATPLGLGFIWSLFEPSKRTWHDIISRTRLVRF